VNPKSSQNIKCPSFEIAAYIDGELDGAHECELEAHFALCPKCSQEMNQQKEFLCRLNSSLKQERDLELPENFTKLVVANAESTVNGLRRPREQFNALFICAGLFLFVLFALGTGVGSVLNGVITLFDQIAAVGGFFGHIMYSIFLGLAIILRSFAAQFRLEVVIGVVLTAFFATFCMFISRMMLRIRRA
jgi:anti-sigma factor RsiW